MLENAQYVKFCLLNLEICTLNYAPLSVVNFVINLENLQNLFSLTEMMRNLFESVDNQNIIDFIIETHFYNLL